MNKDIRVGENQSSQEEKHIGLHIVAFLDALGQQEKLRKLTALPNVDNQEDVAAFKEKIDQLYQVDLGSGLVFQHSIYSNAFQIMLKYKT